MLTVYVGVIETYSRRLGNIQFVNHYFGVEIIFIQSGIKQGMIISYG